MNIFLLVTAIFCFLYCLLIIYYLWGWLHLREYFFSGKLPSVKISVIIPARNEEHNLENILNDLKEQNYSKNLFEVIVIDDFSTDRTADIVKKHDAENVKLLSLKEIAGQEMQTRANKKAAITYAVQIATGELIVTTDADCRVGSHWLVAIAAYYEEYHPEMIAGPVNYFYDNTFLGKFQTLDFLSLVGIAAASIQNGFYNLCNGANLAYTKNAFIKAGGYSGIDHIPGGDDMMLMHKIAKTDPGKISFLKNKDAIVYTGVARDFSSFWRQRVRWTSKSTHYEDKRITLILTFVYLFNVLLAVNFVAGLFQPFYLRVAMWIFLIKIIIDTLFSYSVAKFFRRENLLWLFLPAEVAHVIYVLLIAPAGVFGKYTWKGRVMKRNK